MKNIKQDPAEKYVKEHNKRKWWQRCVSVLAAVAVFCTTYAMILPAITWERSLVCEIPEHHHGDSCYEIVNVPAEKELVCQTTEHVHGTECYKQTRICNTEESEGHTHCDACYTEYTELVCTLEESVEHTHGESCFSIHRQLVCDIEESEGHAHSADCYLQDLICPNEEHVHTDECYRTVGEEHEEKVLVCQLEEHEHVGTCFDAPPAEDDGYYCGQIEHTHSEEQHCFFSDGTLRCTIPEHTHTDSCSIDPLAETLQSEEIVKENRTIISEMASDGAVAEISGYLPTEATAEIEKVYLSESQLIEYFGTAKAKAMNVYATYDITILLDGEEWQPDESVSVTIRKPASSDMGIGQTAVEHIDSITGEAERIQTSTNDDEAISFVTDGFSIYIFYTFTVDYYFGGYEFHQAGLSSMYLSELLTELGIQYSILEIEDVTFSNSSLLDISKDASGDWLLSSLEAFSSDEILILTLKDGEEIRIDTKDVAYTWFNVHNVVIGGNAGDKYYFTFDYYDEYGTHQQYDRWLANYEEINALKVALNTPVTITQIPGKYMDSNGTIHTDGDYDNWLQEGGAQQVHTNIFHVDSITTLHQNVNICFYERSDDGLGILNITKNAVNSSNPNQTYHFVVLYHEMNYKMNAAEFDLKAGDMKTLLYYCDTIYGNNMEIFIAETSSFSNCDVSFTVNGGTAQIPQQENLYGRIHEDIGHQYDGYNFIKIPISGNYDTFNVVCNNTFVDRSVTIRKIAVQGEPNKSYTFTLKAYNASNALVWQGNASVKSGDSSKVTIPVDCSYVIVQETNHAGYTVSMSGSGSNSGTDGRRIPKAQFPADVTFTNTREVVPITLTKKLVCDDMAGAGPFSFEVTVTNSNGNPIDVSTITQSSGITLKSGTSNVLQVSIGGFSSSVTEKSVQINVPKGAKITITEANLGSEYNVTNSLGGTNTAVINSVANGSSVKFTNTEAPSTVSMTVIKHLAGLQNGEFDFEMSVDSPSWPPSVAPADWPSDAVIGTDGVIRFTLTVTNGNAPQITIPGIPAGSEVTITETSHDGFNVKFTDNASAYVHVGYTDTYELTENKIVTVVNTTGTELPSTGGIGVYPIYALGALLIVGSIMYGYILRRRRERRAE